MRVSGRILEHAAVCRVRVAPRVGDAARLASSRNRCDGRERPRRRARHARSSARDPSAKTQSSAVTHRRIDPKRERVRTAALVDDHSADRAEMHRSTDRPEIEDLAPSGGGVHGVANGTGPDGQTVRAAASTSRMSHAAQVDDDLVADRAAGHAAAGAARHQTARAGRCPTDERGDIVGVCRNGDRLWNGPRNARSLGIYARARTRVSLDRSRQALSVSDLRRRPAHRPSVVDASAGRRE